MAFTDGNIIIGTSVDVGGIDTGLSKIQKSFKKLGVSALLTAGLTKAIVNLGKASLDASSDLQEVQNIVDVAFTSVNDAGEVVEDMRYKIEGMAKSAITNFGMSEFAAKQTAGSFMAMGKSMDFSMEEASDMAVKITELTGDFASFYNISQEYARVALSAVYTGETETLKRYGIILTEANLQQFAYKQGIEESVKAMSARDKAILRYMYVMQATEDMQGDFVRTQGSWANSTRVLQQRWNEFLVAMGTGLISVLTPAVQTLNSIVNTLTRLANVLWQIVHNIFGIKIQNFAEEMGKMKETTEGLTDETEDYAGALDDARKSAKKLISPLDELNILSENTSDSDKDNAANMLVLPDIDLGDYSFEDSPMGKIMSDIDNFFDWGKSIGDTISNTLGNIQWGTVFEKFKGFGQELAFFLNGLITSDTFSKVGLTIANSLNAAIKAAFGFAEIFDFTELGVKIAGGVNTFFTTFDFSELASTINLWVAGLWDAVKIALSNISWKSVFEGAKKFFNGLDVKTVELLFGFAILKNIIKKALTINIASAVGGGLLKGFEQGFLGGSMSSILGGKIYDLGQSIGVGLFNATQTIKGNIQLMGKNIGTYFTTYVAPVVTAFGNEMKLSFQVLFNNIKNGYGLDFAAAFDSTRASMIAQVGETATNIAGIGLAVGGVSLAVANFISMFESGWNIIKTILEALGIALAAIGAVILGAPAAVAAIVAGIVFAVSQLIIVLHDNWEAVSAWLAKIGAWINEHVIQPVVQFFKKAWEKVSTTAIKIWGSIKEAFIKIVNWVNDHVIIPVRDFFSGMFRRIGEIAEGCWIIIKAIWIIVSTWFDEHVIQPVVNFFKFLWEKVSGFFVNLWEDIKTVWYKVSAWFDEKVIQPIVNFFEPRIKKIKELFTKLWDDIKLVWGVVSSWFKNHIIDPVVKAWETATTNIEGFFTKLWDGIKEGVKSAFNWVVGKIEDAINGIVDLINSVLSGFNKVVGWAAKFTGDDWAGVELVPNVSIPKLANGAVIPANNPFMAVLGDQKSGTNIEAPLSTIQDAVADVLVPYLSIITDLLSAIKDKKPSNVTDRDIYRSTLNGQRQSGLQIIST